MSIDSETFSKLISSFKELPVKEELDENIIDEEELYRCKHCNKVALKEDDGYRFCNECALVVDNVIDMGCEWRYYFNGVDPSRCGMPESDLLPNASRSTVISGRGPPALYKRLHNWSAMDHKERGLYKVFVYIEQKCYHYNIPKVIVAKTNSNFKKITQYMEEGKKIARAGNRDGLIGACLYNACKELNCPRRTKEIAEILSIDSKNVSVGIKAYAEIVNRKKITLNTPSTTALVFVEPFCSKLRFPENITKKVKKVVVYMLGNGIASDHASESQTAGCIWYVVKKYDLQKVIPKSQISKFLKVSEVTISRCYKKLLNHIEEKEKEKQKQTEKEK